MNAMLFVSQKPDSMPLSQAVSSLAVMHIRRLEQTVLMPSLAGGGACILTNNRTSKFSPVSVPSKHSSLELCVVDILSRSSKLRLFICFRSPNSDSNQVAVQHLCDHCDGMNDMYADNFTVILCGNFNLSVIDWPADICPIDVAMH
jgi:hypothetical protein